MASVNFQVTARCKDGLPIVTPLMIDGVCSTGLLADIQLFAAAWLSKLQDLTDSLIVMSRISIEQSVPGAIGKPVAASKNSDTALMDYELVGTTDTLGQSIPNAIPGAFLTATPTVVNPADPFVSAYNAFLAATTNNCQVTDEAQRAVAGFLGGKSATRKHRKQVARAKSAP